MTMTNKKKLIFVNIIKRYFLNIFKISKQSYSITKQKNRIKTG
jgi:hypothetical protein